MFVLVRLGVHHSAAVAAGRHVLDDVDHVGANDQEYQKATSRVLFR